MKAEFHAFIHDLMRQIYFYIEKIERRISCTFEDLMGEIYFLEEKIEWRNSCTYPGHDRSDLFLRRENCKENFMHLFRT